jgi:hypothetical protein
MLNVDSMHFNQAACPDEIERFSLRRQRLESDAAGCCCPQASWDARHGLCGPILRSLLTMTLEICCQAGKACINIDRERHKNSNTFSVNLKVVVPGLTCRNVKKKTFSVSLSSYYEQTNDMFFHHRIQFSHSSRIILDLCRFLYTI